MDKSNLLRRFRQYGYDTDAFDKYRDAVAQYNRSAPRVLGISGCLTGVVSLIAMPAGGLFIAGLMLVAGGAGTATEQPIFRLRQASAS